MTEPLQAGPPAWHGQVQLGFAVLLVVSAFAVLDGLGRVLALPVVALLAIFGLRDLLVRPVLTADAEGVTVADGLHLRAVAWAEVERLRVVKDRRTPLLELDLGSAIVVLSTRRLGRPPENVLVELEQLRDSGPAG